MFKKSVAVLAMIFAFTAVACDRDEDAATTDEGTAAEATETAEQAAAAAPAGEDVAGISGATLASELTDEQITTFCAHLGETLVSSQEGDEMKKAGCLLGGLMMAAFSGAEDEAATAAACQEAYDECIAQEDPEEEMPSPDICPDSEELANCQASVAEIDACMKGMIEYGFGALRELSDSSCEELATEEGGQKVEAAMARMQELGGDVPNIPACAPVREKCSSFFEN